MARGGKRRGAGRPLGSRDTRTSAQLIELARERDGIVPVKIDGDSRAVLQKQMNGEVWLSREQIYAAKALLPIEYPPAVTHDGRSVEEIKAEGVREYLAAQPDSSEALINAILRLKFDEDEPKGPPPQIFAPPLPRPRVRPKPEPPVIDGKAESSSADLGSESRGKPGGPQLDMRLSQTSSHKPAPDGRQNGGKSEPEPELVEETQEEARNRAAIQTFPHLLPRN